MEARSTKMNFFDLSELDKLSDTKKKGGQLRRSIPNVLAKAVRVHVFVFAAVTH